MDTQKDLDKNLVSQMVPIETGGKRPKKYFGKWRKPLTNTPNFVEPQVKSFEWLVKHSL
jgi:hypothetical protein